MTVATTDGPASLEPLIRIIRGGVMELTLADVAARNVVSIALMTVLSAALDEAAKNDAIRVVVVGNLGKVFCAGADLKASPNANTSDQFAALLRQIQTSPKPTIAKVTGQAIGGGVGLAAAFDISVASASSKFGFTEVRLGVVPAVISVVCLPKMRRVDALECYLRGTRFDALRAAELGLITRAVPDDRVDEEIAAIVSDILLGGPKALAIAKSLVETVPQLGVAEGFKAMAELSAKVFASPEARGGTTAFAKREQPPWVE